MERYAQQKGTSSAIGVGRPAGRPYRLLELVRDDREVVQQSQGSALTVREDCRDGDLLRTIRRLVHHAPGSSRLAEARADGVAGSEREAHADLVTVWVRNVVHTHRRLPVDVDVLRGYELSLRRLVDRRRRWGRRLDRRWGLDRRRNHRRRRGRWNYDLHFRDLAVHLGTGIDASVINQLEVHSNESIALGLDDGLEGHLLDEASVTAGLATDALGGRVGAKSNGDLEVGERAHHDHPSNDHMGLRLSEPDEVAARHLAPLPIDQADLHVAGVPEPEQPAIGGVPRIPVSRNVRASADPSAPILRLGLPDHLLRQPLGHDVGQDGHPLGSESRGRNLGVADRQGDRRRQVSCRGRSRIGRCSCARHAGEHEYPDRDGQGENEAQALHESHLQCDRGHNRLRHQPIEPVPLLLPPSIDHEGQATAGGTI